MKRFTFLLLGLALLCSACTTDYANLPTYTPNKQLQAVVETPAGSSHKLLFDRATKAFVNEKEAGKDRVIRFLPYPGNYGFIPSTEVGGKSAPLQVLVIAESAAPGTVLEIIPVGVLQLDISGELHPQIIAIPARPSEQLITAHDFASFSKRYPAIKTILEQWFLHHNPAAPARLGGWRDEKFANQMIQRWMKL
ncbi:inorganic diphosphatase [Pontibacter beigongshangensis]|uniref:inorganic diphosphatase n=1 Tax=Pontibacter beigongshangensis TaxID=2574733 RepID=UPI0018892477|nr:inorganic diphosphatase [Pontibacter beigongshangensis]